MTEQQLPTAKVCPGCGNEYGVECQYCIACGSPLVEKAFEPVVTPAAPAIASSTDDKQKGRSTALVVLSSCILGVLVLILGTLLVMSAQLSALVVSHFSDEFDIPSHTLLLDDENADEEDAYDGYTFDQWLDDLRNDNGDVELPNEPEIELPDTHPHRGLNIHNWNEIMS